MKPFVYTPSPARVVFGTDALTHLERELDLLGARKALVLCTPPQRPKALALADRLGKMCAGIYDQAEMHVPAAIAAAACDQARSVGADIAIALGGGSTIGLAKILARELGLPILAIPTTYAGSEMTPIYATTDGGLKQTGKDVRVLPKTVIYDPALTLSLPAHLSITSGINAIAHAAEGLYAQDANPVMATFAEQGIRALSQALPRIVRNPVAIDARSDALYGAWMCGTVLGSVGMALHHKLCHTLGGSFNLPHAEVHTIVLPHALRYNEEAAPDAMQVVARALGARNAAQGCFDLARDNGAPVSLRDIGMHRADLDKAVAIALEKPYWNPRPIKAAPLRELLEAAFEGIRPR